ncbi:hypothetical protein KKF86_02240, partial [bacterium]|nr:hypothetical protein [bacterium]
MDLSNLSSHSGNINSENLVYFSNPSSKLGEILTAFSTVTENSKTFNWQDVYYIRIIGPILGILIGCIFNYYFEISPEKLNYLSLPALFSMIILYYCVKVTFTVKRCTYVGTKGISR